LPDSRRFQKKMDAHRDDFMKSLNLGEFAGDFRLKWVGPSNFQYIPDPDDPFRFIRHDENGEVRGVVQPEKMRTTGGSVPKIIQLVPGLSSWDYGPAYMIHDWEFEAHDRGKEPGATRYRKSFKQVNLTLAEAIWTLMIRGYKRNKKPKKNANNVVAVYRGVSSAIGRAIWKD
jgi:hypothetical protein